MCNPHFMSCARGQSKEMEWGFFFTRCKIRLMIQKVAVSLTTFTLLVLSLSSLRCEDGGPVNDEPPIQLPPPPPSRLGCPFKHVEIDDTTRSYTFWDGSVHYLTPSYVDVRFAKGTSDSSALAIAAKYRLRFRTHWFQSTMYVFCVPEGGRAEEVFTPYGKSNVKNFGSEPLVEVAFGLFDNGLNSYLDEFTVRDRKSVV